MSQPFASHRLVPGWFPFECGESDSLPAMVCRWRQANFRGQIVGPHGCGKTTLTIALSQALGPEFADYCWLTARPTPGLGLRCLSRVRWVETTLFQHAAIGSGMTGVDAPANRRVGDHRAEAGDSKDHVAREKGADSQSELGQPALHGMAPLPLDHKTESPAGRRKCIFVDGWEQLAFWQRWWYWRRWSGDRFAVLITSHRPIPGLAIVAQLQPRLDVFRRFAQRCLDEYRAVEFESGPVAESLPQIFPEEIDAAFARHAGDFREALFALYDLYETKRSGAANSSPVAKHPAR